MFESIKFRLRVCKICGRLLAICRAVASFVTLLSSIVFILFRSFISEELLFRLYYNSIDYLEHIQRHIGLQKIR